MRTSERWPVAGHPNRPSVNHVVGSRLSKDAHVPVCEIPQGGRVDGSRYGSRPLTPTGHHAMMLSEHGTCRITGVAHNRAPRHTPRALGSMR
jgi:hypothetical protein